MIAACLLSLVCTASAQTTIATVTGTVTAASGATIPGATVTATHLASNCRFTGSPTDSGTYTSAQLREGEYALRVTAPGFKKFAVAGVARLLPSHIDSATSTKGKRP